MPTQEYPKERPHPPPPDPGDAVAPPLGVALGVPGDGERLGEGDAEGPGETDGFGVGAGEAEGCGTPVGVGVGKSPITTVVPETLSIISEPDDVTRVLPSLRSKSILVPLYSFNARKRIVAKVKLPFVEEPRFAA